MSSDTVLSVRNLSKRYEIYDKPLKRLWQMLCVGRRTFYREFWALRDVSFDVHAGESVGIIGRNGAGKSTLLKIITGTLLQTTGTVWTKPDLRIAALLELGSGFNPEFSGRDNVYLNASILGLSRQETERRYQDIVKFADIGDFIDQPVNKYSSGMKVRLAFAVQIMVDPDILIVDEALAVGDMFFQQKCMHHMHLLQERGCTLFFVSHSLPAVRSLCAKAIYLEDGKVKMVGSAKEVCDNYAMSLATGVGKAKPRAAVQLQMPVAAIKSQTASVLPFRVDGGFNKRLTERRGSGQVRYVAAGFYDERGCPVHIAECGQIVRFVASFSVLKDIPAGMVVGFGCRDKFGNPLISLNLHTFHCVLPALKAGANRMVEYVLRIPLNAGEYFWSVGAQPDPDKNEFYDYCLGAALLTVVKGKTYYSRYQWGTFLVCPVGISMIGEKKRTVLFSK